MTSREMNDNLYELDDKDFDNIGGKAIFYWGWFWREVDFDDYPYTLCHGYGDEDVVGFCENNKWGHSYLDVSAEESKELRRLMEKSLTTNRGKDFNIVNNYMQGLRQNRTK